MVFKVFQIFHEQYEIEESWRVAGRPPHFTQTLVSAVAACGDVAKFEGVVTGEKFFFKICK